MKTMTKLEKIATLLLENGYSATTVDHVVLAQYAEADKLDTVAICKMMQRLELENEQA